MVGGEMGSSRLKTLEVARTSIEQFFIRNRGRTWFWTFSEPGRAEGEKLWTKDEAEDHFKCFRDLCHRRGVELLVVWERQKRGSWHPHCLINKRFDVHWLRPWMVERGWGPQMRAEYIGDTCAPEHFNRRGGGPCDSGRYQQASQQLRRIMGYLTKYLTKGLVNDGSLHKKKFCSSVIAKRGSTRFSWASTHRAGAYLYAHGRELFFEMFGRIATFRDVALVIRLGVEVTKWADVDPLWEFGFP